MIGAGLSAPTDSVAGIAAATASPAVSYQIGQYFKGLAQKNPDGRLTSGQETAHILAHGVLGAAVSAAGGNDALAGALASGGAEAAAPVIGRWLYGKGDGGSLSAEEKETVSAITRMLGAAAGVATGNSAADVVRGGMAADEAVGNNFYLTSEALKKDEQTARKIYSVIKEQVKHECSSKGRITECRQNIGRIIEFTQDKRFDSRFKDLKKESLYYLNQHPDLVASYLKAEYEKLDREDKSILHRYISPGAEIVSGSLGFVLSSAAAGGACAETFGLGCAVALVGIPSSYDHVVTGTKNFGKKASEQRPTITVQTLKQLGLSEQAAEYVQFSIDLFSVGKSVAGMPKAKPVSDAKPRWEVDRKLNKLTTREQVEKNVQEIRNGNKNSNFGQHAQLEREINKLKSADEINFADGMGKFTDSMDDKAFSRLVKSVKENGFTNPVVEYVEINGKAYIVRGNNRVFAAEYLGRIHELKFKKVDFPVPNTSWKNPTDVLNESGNVKRPRYRSK